MSSSVPLGLLLSGGSPIDLDGSFFLQLGIFVVAFEMLRRLVFRPVIDLFDAREAAIDGAKKNAEETRAEAESHRDHFEGELRKVNLAANQDRAGLRQEAQKLARELTDKARKESASILTSAKSRLEGEALDARRRAKTEVPQLARQIADKLLDRSVN